LFLISGYTYTYILPLHEFDKDNGFCSRLLLGERGQTCPTFRLECKPFQIRSFALGSSNGNEQQEWPHIVSPWETTTPGEMPIWQYTAAALHHGEPQMAYYPHGSPISPNAPAVMSSPSTVFANDGRFTPMTPIYDMSNPSAKADRSPPQMMHLQVPEFTEGADGDGSMDDDSEEGYTWDSNRSPNTPSSASNNRQQRPSSHRRSNSANENSLKNAKRAHTVVERNYRERLNDKIADLALYLFETSSDCKTSPALHIIDSHMHVYHLETKVKDVW